MMHGSKIDSTESGRVPIAPPRRHAQRGGALVELSMLSPILVIMMVGMVDFGRVFYSGIAISHAARAGAQYGIISQTNAENGNGIVQAALNDLEDVQGVAVTTETYCACASGAVVSCDTRCGTREGSPRVYVRVVAQKTFQTIIDYPGIPHSVNIQREAVMRVR